MTVPRNIQRRQMRQQKKTSKKTTTTTTEASVEDRRRVQGIGDNSGGDSKSMTVPVDRKRQRSVYFLSIVLLTVTMSLLCLVAVSFWYCFSHITFLPVHCEKTIKTAIVQKIYLYQVYTNLAYASPTYRRVKNYEVS